MFLMDGLTPTTFFECMGETRFSCKAKARIVDTLVDERFSVETAESHDHNPVNDRGRIPLKKRAFVEAQLRTGPAKPKLLNRHLVQQGMSPLGYQVCASCSSAFRLCPLI